MVVPLHLASSTEQVQQSPHPILGPQPAGISPRGMCVKWLRLTGGRGVGECRRRACDRRMLVNVRHPRVRYQVAHLLLNHPK